MFLLTHDFSCSKSFVSFSFDKMTTEKYSFVSIVLNSNPVGGLFAAVISAKTQFVGQSKINSNSQLINGLFNPLQQLL